MAARRPANLCVVTLGCAKNQVDAESAMGLLHARGFTLVNDPEQADVLLLNTCAFIKPAEEETVQALMEAAALKHKGRLQTLAVVGCLVSKYGAAKLKRLVPEIDVALPPAAIADWVDHLAPGLVQSAPRQLLSPAGSAYLKIAEGCSRQCSFCLIPQLRGPLHSRPLPELIRETGQLVRQGVSEVVLVAQDTTQYGVDLFGKPALPRLLDALVKVRGLKWIRLMYLYPENVTPDLIRRIAQEKKICKYLDIPLQHSERSVLRKMGRPGDAQHWLQLIKTLRQAIPGVALRTTMLSGFPGETASEHQALLRFIDQAQFDRLGAFAYSREAGTRAALLPGQVAAATKKKRVAEIMARQLVISRSQLAKRVGEVVECLIEDPCGPRRMIGRTRWDAPEVDGAIVLHGQAAVGSLVRARVTGSTDHDLQGDIL